MKKTILFLSISALLTSCYSLMPTSVSLEPISKTIETTGDKDELYVKSNNWMVETFNNAKSVIQFTDKESGTVIGRYLLEDNSFNYNYQYIERTIYAIIKLEVKDDAARITISPQPFDTTHKKEQAASIVYSKIENLMLSYENYLSKKEVSW